MKLLKTKTWAVMISLGSLLLLSGCSYATDFVIINASSQPAQVSYRTPRSTTGLLVSGVPATIAANQLSSNGGQEWKLLEPDDYKVVHEDETELVTLTLLPGEALRIASIHRYPGHADANAARGFPVKEIHVGTEGHEINLVNESARTSFSKVSSALYTLTYK